MTKTYEIYWSDLTASARKRLKEINDGNMDLVPIAIIEINDDENLNDNEQEEE